MSVSDSESEIVRLRESERVGGVSVRGSVSVNVNVSESECE